MRFTTAYYLMLLYVTVMIKPLIPFIQDEWSHEFHEIEHISIVHAKYGSHHLEKELANADSSNDKSKTQNTVKSEDQVPLHVLIQASKLDPFVHNSSTQYHSFTLCNLPLISIVNQGPPPKFS